MHLGEGSGAQVVQRLFGPLKKATLGTPVGDGSKEDHADNDHHEPDHHRRVDLAGTGETAPVKRSLHQNRHSELTHRHAQTHPGGEPHPSTQRWRCGNPSSDDAERTFGLVGVIWRHNTLLRFVDHIHLFAGGGHAAASSYASTNDR